jgi:hypothetical protein
MEKQGIAVEELLVLLKKRPQVAELENQVQWLMDQLRLAKHKQFGASSEQTDLNQLYLFNEAEQSAVLTARSRRLLRSRHITERKPALPPTSCRRICL